MHLVRYALREAFHLFLNYYLSLIVIVLACITYGIFYYGILATLIDCGIFLAVGLIGLIFACFIISVTYLLTNKLPEVYFKRFFQTNLLCFVIAISLNIATMFGFTIAIPMMLKIFLVINSFFFEFNFILFCLVAFDKNLNYLNHHIKTLYQQGHLSFFEAPFAVLNLKICPVLRNANIRTLFENKSVTLDQLRTCNQTTLDALDNQAIYNDLLHKRITWDQVPLRYAQLTKSDQIRINKPQSTHTASVHDSISESAQKLSEQFNKQLNVTTEINNLKEQITNFQPNTHISNHQKQAALRSFNKKIAFFDPVSSVSYNQLIALTFVAAKNDDYRDHTFNDYLEAIILALYEVQRGYNINEAGIDDMRKDDAPICESGSFNKIVEKMVGILPDCEIKNINSEVIYLKLFSTIKSEIINLFTKPNTIILPESTESTDDSTLLNEILIKDASCNQQQSLKTKLINNITVILEEEFEGHLDKVTTDGYTLDDFISEGLNNDEATSCLHDEIKKLQSINTKNIVNRHSMFARRPVANLIPTGKIGCARTT